MCGFTGYMGSISIGAKEEAEFVLRRMTNTILHRGPDSDGYWLDPEAGIALGHRRLAVVDLSSEGAQPMQSASGRYVIAFNGEIYNHLQLRAELDGGFHVPGWNGHTDTETLLAAFEVWGIEATVRKCIGMFAFALWDRERRTLALVRDRLGEKPLYYGWQGSGESKVFLFGSELKALRAHPAFLAGVDRDALAMYLSNMAVPGHQSIYQGIQKVPPGSLMTFSRATSQPLIQTYWSLTEVAIHGVVHPFDGSAREAVDMLETLLRESVGQQMVADVQLGAFLSGGVDSSTVVALMQAQSCQPVKTFSIGFNEESFNEADHAKAIALHLGTDHTELYVTPRQAIDVIPSLPALYDEPFADSSQIPTYLVSKLARRHVTVALTGDAGDELFCGYQRYTFADTAWRQLTSIPMPLRKFLAKLVLAMPPAALNAFGSRFFAAPGWARIGDRLHKGAAIIGSRSLEDFYLGIVSNWRNSDNIVIRGQVKSYARLEAELKYLSNIERLMALDLLNYLPDDILTKVDRAAMGVGLETRVPFLDHRVVEFAWSLPLHYKLRREGIGFTTKWALRQVLCRYVPRSLFERPKKGFSVPINSWLRGPLRAWAEDLLDDNRMRQEGFFNPEPIRKKWREHLSGQRNWQNQIWGVLMFQAWLANQKATGRGS